MNLAADRKAAAQHTQCFLHWYVAARAAIATLAPSRSIRQTSSSPNPRQPRQRLHDLFHQSFRLAGHAQRDNEGFDKPGPDPFLVALDRPRDCLQRGICAIIRAGKDAGLHEWSGQH
ncbi:hypothetical protein HC256_009061 [Beauveria bassiana]|nr:hypothetical protein HC256_009061 [Beauveria bassiana]